MILNFIRKALLKESEDESNDPSLEADKKNRSKSRESEDEFMNPSNKLDEILKNPFSMGGSSMPLIFINDEKHNKKDSLDGLIK